jgi:O-acetyl-ADP-ribose deacetylase
MRTEYQSGKGKIEIAEGSITRYNADAIVVPANPDLDFEGMGVQGFVARDGGFEIFDESAKVADRYAKQHGCVKIHDMRGKVPLYSAHLTTGGKLPAKHVIHSVALDYNPKSGVYCNKEVIAKSTRKVLELGREHGLKSIGFPALGTGLYQVPLEEAVQAMTAEFEKHLAGETSLETLGIVLFGQDSYLQGSSYLRANKEVRE